MSTRRVSPAARCGHRRRTGAVVVAALLPLLVACGAADPVEPPAAMSAPVRVVQMNLCNSGIAGCFTGEAVGAAAGVIAAEVPDAVTLNEVCRADLAELERALADAAPGAEPSSAFRAARNRDTGEPYRCRNGDEFGVGVVARAASSVVGEGIHPAQDPEDPEQRAWLCLDTTTGAGPVGVCTSHLAYTDRAVTLAQCRYLFDTVVADLRARDTARPVVVGADLNLGGADDPDLRSCLPAAAVPAADDGVQHVVVEPVPAEVTTRVVDLRGTTDHPALVVTSRAAP